MSTKKKLVRATFRESVFERDGHKCKMCGHKPSEASVLQNGQEVDPPLDAHHITDRNDMPNGGYVAENGISLCGGCHVKAEVFHSTGVSYHGFSPDDLYSMIGSSYAKAYEASEKLKS